MKTDAAHFGQQAGTGTRRREKGYKADECYTKLQDEIAQLVGILRFDSIRSFYLISTDCRTYIKLNKQYIFICII